MQPKEPQSRSVATLDDSPVTASVRIGPLVGLPALLRSLGCDPRRIVEQAGFKLTQFEDPDLRIPFVQGSKMLAACVAATGCEHLGLLLGERSVPSHLGIAGFMLQSAPDVRVALRGLLDYLDLHDEGGTPILVTSGETTLLGYAIHLPDVAAQDQLYDLSAVFAYKIMHALCGGNWKPRKVLMMRREPRNPARYKRFFRVPIHFNSEQNGVVFPTRWLDHPLATRDPLLHKHLEHEAATLRSSRENDLASRLRSLLHQCLISDRCSVSRIAGQLGIHERTLNRRLKSEGTSFRQELDQVRFTVARQLLSATDASLVEIAVSLGYADGSAFSHAFKRWSGVTPAHWRATRVKPDGD